MDAAPRPLSTAMETARKQVALATSAGAAQKAAIFLHIGKTAGTTLEAVMKGRFQPPTMTLDSLDEWAAARELARLRPEVHEKLNFVSGHLLYGVHHNLSRPALYFSLLRDPLARLVSAYRHVRDRPGHRLHDALVDSNMTFTDFVVGGITLETDNWQVRVIAGDVSTPFGRCDGLLLQKAKANIAENFSLVGLTEAFDESLVVLSRMYGWRRLHYFPHNRAANFAPGGLSEQFPRGVTEAIAPHTEVEQELYDYCRELLARVGSQLVDIDRDVRRLRLANALYYPVGRLREPISVWREKRRQLHYRALR